MPANDILKRV